MPQTMQNLMELYITEIQKIYGDHLRKVILYGSYARGDFHADSDVDLMILLDMSDMELKVFSRQLSYMTYDFNMDHEVDIKPISKSEEHFRKWVANYPFYANILINPNSKADDTFFHSFLCLLSQTLRNTCKQDNNLISSISCLAN